MSKITDTIPTAQERLEFESKNRPNVFARIEAGEFDDVIAPIVWIIGAHGTKGGAVSVPRWLNADDRKLLTEYFKTKGWVLSYIMTDSFFSCFGFGKDRVHLKMYTPPPSILD